MVNLMPPECAGWSSLPEPGQVYLKNQGYWEGRGLMARWASRVYHLQSVKKEGYGDCHTK